LPLKDFTAVGATATADPVVAGAVVPAAAGGFVAAAALPLGAVVADAPAVVAAGFGVSVALDPPQAARTVLTAAVAAVAATPRRSVRRLVIVV